MASQANIARLADMERQLEREIAFTDKELQATMLFLSSKRKEKEDNCKVRHDCSGSNLKVKSTSLYCTKFS